MWGFVMSLNLERDSARSKKRLSISLLLCATIMFVMVLLIVSNPVYAVPHQTLTFSYSVSGGGSGYTAPTLSRTVNNVSTNIALTGTPTAYLTDTGTPWSVTNPLTDSDPSEHWQTSETTSGTVSTDLTIGFTYYNQYNVTFDASSNVKLDSAATIVTVAGAAMTAADLPYSGWFNSGSSLSYAYSTTVASTASPTDTQYRWNSTSGLSQTLQSNTFTVSGAGTVTGTYVAQYKVTFAQSGLTSDASGTVVTVDNVDKAYGDLPFTTDWIDSGSSVTYSYSSPVASTGSPTDTQYRWASTSGLDTLQTDTLTVSGAGTVTGTYVTQYKVTFAQSGLTSDASGTVVTVDNVDKAYGDLPFSKWVDNSSSVSFSYSASVSSSVTSKQYVLTEISGNATSSPLTVNSAVTVIGNYETQYFITVNANGHGSPTEVSTWVPAGSDFTVSVTAPDVVDATHQWNLTGLVVDGSPATWNDSVTFYGVAGAHSVEFDWTENFYITVVSAHGSPTASAWVDQGAGLTVSVSSPADDNGAGT